MEKTQNKGIHEIDNSVREKMDLLDRHRNNFFEKDFSLITDFEPYRDKIVCGKVMRSPEHRVIYVPTGRMTLEVAMEEFDLRPGALLLVPAGSLIVCTKTSSDYSPLTLAFNNIAVDSERLMDIRPIMILLPESKQQIVGTFFNLFGQLVKEDEVNWKSISKLEEAFMSLLHQFVEGTVQPDTASLHSQAAKLTRKFLIEINNGIPERSVSTYADRLNVSPEYLGSVVKKQTGQTPLEWINRRTIREIQTLLIENEGITLDEVAEIVYCSNASQLIKFFKKHTGETPNEYRRRMK